MKSSKLFFAIAMIMTIAIAGCKKDEKTARVNFRLTDAPANYDAVYVDVQGIEVQTAAGGWVTLNSNLGVIDLLELSNGKDTLITGGDFPAGRVNQVRLMLGANNSIVVNGVTHNLETPSAQKSGLKLNLMKELEAAVTYEWTIDFDAHMSVVATGSGNYILKPVLRMVTDGIDGVISGTLLPPIAASVCAVTATDTFCTNSNIAGQFAIQGVPPGNYDLLITPPLPLSVTVVNNVSVTAGQNTNVGVVNL